MSSLKDLKIVMAGAGSAGLGVANIIYQYKKKLGASVERAYNDFYIFD